MLQAQPSMPSGPSAPGDTYGLPPENDGPGATETNFFTLPCSKDSDCSDGKRCILGARVATDAGLAADAGDAGLASDAGAGLGRCERGDGG